jgi:hypothetical protein
MSSLDNVYPIPGAVSTNSYGAFPMVAHFNSEEFNFFLDQFAKDGNLYGLRRLLEVRSLSAQEFDQTIHTALARKHLDLVTELMKYCVDSRIRGECVIAAAEMGNFEIVQTWLPDPSMITKESLAIAKAKAGDHLEIVDYLTGKQATQSTPCCVVQ